MNKKIILLATSILGFFFMYAQNFGSSPELIVDKQIDTVLMPEGKVMLNRLSSSTIIEGGWYPNALYLISSGQLLAHGTWKRKNYTGGWWQASGDGGVTWQPCVNTEENDYARLQPFMCRRRDGSLIGWDGTWNRDTSFRGRPGRPVTQAIVHAPSFQALIQGKGNSTEEATVYLPYMVPLSSDDLRKPPIYVPAIWGKLVEADHGYLIQGTYPRLAYDNAPRLWEEQKVPAFKYRTCVIYSQDDGTTWHYLATVASPEQYPLPANAEGYCEPDLLYLGNGHLLCVMRTGGNPSGSLMERFTPLVASHSHDGGLTWTAPEPIAAYGVAPVLLQMKSGLVVCLSGRPGFFLLFSADRGKSWSAPYWLNKSNGTWGRSSSGYGQLIELAPGVLGIAYDEYVGEVDNARMVTKFRRYHIER